MSKKSTRKGKVGEREAARLLTENGIPAERNLTECRRGQGRDLITEAPLCVQVKRQARPNPLRALQEAQGGAETGEVPLALVRADGDPWVVVGLADDLLPMISYWFHCLQHRRGDRSSD